MSIIKQDLKRLDNIAKAYWNTSGEMREMWGRKWYALIKIISDKTNLFLIYFTRSLIGAILLSLFLYIKKFRIIKRI